MSKIGLLWRTVRYLKPRQVAYQVINRLRKRAVLHLPTASPKAFFLSVPDADKPASYVNQTFTFLNQSVAFPDRINWNYAANGKLWTYNLNYFDFLNQPGLTAIEGRMLIRNFIDQTDALHDGLEPYPTSLRIINWIQFLSRHQLQNETINSYLFAQIDLLSRRLEYHLAGNHLLENGFALLMGAMYFRQRHWLHQAATLLYAELATQVLADGGHDERSPVYHQILLGRLLDVLLAVRYDPWHGDLDFMFFLEDTAAPMVDWLGAITFANGDVPMMNDAAFGIAPTTAQIRAKVARIKLRTAPPQLIESGYRLFRQPRYELFADVGAVGPDHQPGHAHADTFSFVLTVDNRPVIVDSGTSTYEIGSRRAWERSTAAHNTVEVEGLNSSEVWGGFRVGRRARTTLLTDTETTLLARHDGYRHIAIIHERTWQVQPDRIDIIDRLIDKTGRVEIGRQAVARLYFHPDIVVVLNQEQVVAGPVQLTFSSGVRLRLMLSSYEMAEGFNRYRAGQCLAIAFDGELKTTLTCTECEFYT